MSKKKKIRTDFRKNHQGKSRRSDLTRDLHQERINVDETIDHERVSGKGDATRKRTIIANESAIENDSENEGGQQLDVSDRDHLRGRVLAVYGLSSLVEAEDGREFRCAVRRLLKNLSTEQRHILAAGDIVHFRLAGNDEGMIEKIEPRKSMLCRTSKGRLHVIVANVDQLLIVASAAEPTIKPNLIDRYLIAAEQWHIRPIICINKMDLVDPADFQPLAGVYGQMGYEVHLVSAETGQGIAALRKLLVGRESVVSGQSGVGKSSLLNAIEPNLGLRIGEVSQENQKGKHTTTTARLIRMDLGGHVIDTPGIRQFQLWDVISAEVAGFYRDLRPFVNLCRFPDCTHTHEANCAVKDAVADNKLDARRYESYCHVLAGDEE